MSGTNNKIWTENEIQLLKDNYSINGVLHCTALINRSIKAIRKKANDLKLSKIYNKEQYNEENLKTIIKSCKSLSEVLKKINLRTAGGNFITIKNYIEKYNINIEHFETPLERNTRVSLKNINFNNVFKEESETSRKTLKNYMFKYFNIKNICVFCGQDENWYGKKITLILDHINGIYNDNRIENLRIVCPNCNATLDTHCGKNVKQKNAPFAKLE